jgi:glycosyltransferase involved in cell wall biosynthesis
MLSWEYPPRIIGGLARHVEGLSRALVALGHTVHVLTLDFPGAAAEESNGLLFLHRVPVELPAPTFHDWVLLFNHFFEKKIGQIVNEFGKPDIIHVHDWLTVPAGVASKHLLRVPLVMTFHSTESARSPSSSSPESSLVKGLEWWGSYEASTVVAVSEWMKDQIVTQFNLPARKVVNIPNAVDTDKFNKRVNRTKARHKWSIKPGEKLITAVGRLTSQKGFDDLIRAFPIILKYAPNARLLLIGDGYMRSELQELAQYEGVASRITLAGFISDPDLIDAIKSSDVIVVPSRFEPFGIIALEAMAAGVPVVVSRVGGLAEIVQDTVDGLEVDPNKPESIAEATVRIILDDDLAEELAAMATEKVKTYNWEYSANETVEAYKTAIRDAKYE